MIIRKLALALIAPCISLVAGPTLSDRFDNFERSGSLFDFVMQDAPDDLQKMYKQVYSVMDTPDEKWIVKGTPYNEPNYYELTFVPSNNYNSMKEHLLYQCRFDDPAESLKTHWETVVKHAEKNGYTVEILSQSPDSIAYKVYSSNEIPSGRANLPIRVYYNSIGLVTEFENHLVWAFEYVYNYAPISKERSAKILDNIKTIQSKFINE
jgi:hypothetical protein